MTQLDEKHAAYEVLLLLADADARWWDYGNAVRLLDHAAEAGDGLPLEYEFKRALAGRDCAISAAAVPRPGRAERPENKL